MLKKFDKITREDIRMNNKKTEQRERMPYNEKKINER